MKNIYLLFLLLSLPSLCLAEGNCKSDLESAIKEFLKDDDTNYFGNRYVLTSLKMAKILNQEHEKTLESFISKNHAKLDNTESQKKLESIYQKYGKSQDIEAVKQEINEFKKRAVNANYFNPENRFYNHDSSAFIAALSAGNPHYGLNETDVAAVWMMGHVSDAAKEKYKKNSVTHNLTNLSTQLARYTGAVGIEPMDPKELEGKIQELEDGVKKSIEDLRSEFLKSNKKCFETGAEFQECNFTVGFIEAEILNNLAAIKSKVESQVSIDESLKGQLGEIHFDISDANFAPEAKLIIVKIRNSDQKKLSNHSNTSKSSEASKTVALRSVTKAPIKPQQKEQVAVKANVDKVVDPKGQLARSKSAQNIHNDANHSRFKLCHGYCLSSHRNPASWSQMSSDKHNACKLGFGIAQANYLNVRNGKSNASDIIKCQKTADQEACVNGFKRMITCMTEEDTEPETRIGATRVRYAPDEREYPVRFDPKTGAATKTITLTFCQEFTEKFKKDFSWDGPAQDVACSKCELKPLVSSLSKNACGLKF